MALGYLKSAHETDEELFAALKTFQLIENFDERIQETGLIDRKVVEFMAQMIDKQRG
ncbi:MAG: putative peptidoglycan binding domain-containing protein [Desulfitobacteriaceae bacterium]